MRNASGHRGENERRWKKKMNRNTYNISSIKRNWKFHVVVVQNNGKEMYKKVCCTLPIVAVRVKGRMVKGRGMETGNARYGMWTVWDPLPPSQFPTRLFDS